MTKAELIEEVSRVVEMTRKDSEVIVEAIFDSVVRALRSGRQNRDPRLRQLPHAPAAAARGAQSQDRRARGSAGQAHPVFQAQQGTERPGERRRGAAPETARTRRATDFEVDYLWSPWRYRYVSSARGLIRTSSSDRRVFVLRQGGLLRRSRKPGAAARRAQFRPAESVSVHQRAPDDRAVRACGHASRTPSRRRWKR